VLLADGGELRSTDSATGPVQVAIRPWDVRIAREGDLMRTVTALAPAGPQVLVQLGDIEAHCAPEDIATLGVERGARVGVSIAPENVRVFCDPPVPLTANQGEFHG
jgi:hypothetical protein